jgi:hypothetical protein
MSVPSLQSKFVLFFQKNASNELFAYFFH